MQSKWKKTLGCKEEEIWATYNLCVKKRPVLGVFGERHKISSFMCINENKEWSGSQEIVLPTDF